MEFRAYRDLRVCEEYSTLKPLGSNSSRLRGMKAGPRHTHTHLGFRGLGFRGLGYAFYSLLHVAF